MTEPQDSTPLAVWVAAVICGMTYGIIFYVLTAVVHPRSGLVLGTLLVGAPLAAPALAVLVLDPRGKMSLVQHFKLGLLVIAAILAVGVVFLQEGGLCLIMASPLFLVGGVLGAVAAGAILRWRSRHFCLVLIAMPFAALPADGADRYPARIETVTSVVEVDAPVAVVWNNAVAVANIRPSELGWTFTQDVVGIPKPLDARLTGTGPGAVRHVTWGRNVHFEERIVGWEKDRLLAWNFHFARDSIPRSIEAHLSPDSDYLKVQSGSYRFTPLANGHTRVTLQTRYWMRTPLNAYCALWGRIFIPDFHRNVLRVIRERSERVARPV